MMTLSTSRVGMLAVLLLASVVGVASGGPRGAAAASPSGDSSSVEAPVVVYYFHREMRCQSCILLEDMTRWAVESGYAEEIAAGQLALRSVNVDVPENEHFVGDFDLEFQAVVLAAYEQKEVVRWRNLERVWDLYGTPTDFDRYLFEQIDEFRERPGDDPMGADGPEVTR